MTALSFIDSLNRYKRAQATPLHYYIKVNTCKSVLVIYEPIARWEVSNSVGNLDISVPPSAYVK